MMKLLDRIISEYESKQEAKKRELLRRYRISTSLKRVNEIKRNEKGFHRVRYSENGVYLGYYLLPDLK